MQHNYKFLLQTHISSADLLNDLFGVELNETLYLSTIGRTLKQFKVNQGINERSLKHTRLYNLSKRKDG